MLVKRSSSKTSILGSLVTIMTILVLVAGIVVLLNKFTNITYDVSLVTPLFFIHALGYLILPIMFFNIISIYYAFLRRNKTLFVLSLLILYYLILFAPLEIFRFTIYNDQLGFALEVLQGIYRGFITPHQGEFATLGHAYFSSILGLLLGLDLFITVRFVETISVFIFFVLYLSRISFPSSYNINATKILILIAMLFYPAFALDPSIYSRGYFGLTISLFLFMSTLKFLDRMSVEGFVLLLLTFITSSISYPLQPLLLAVSFSAMSLLLALLLSRESVRRAQLYRAIWILTMISILLFIIWFLIQAYLGGYGSWVILREITTRIFSQEYFTSVKATPALRYVGEAALYSMIRIIMITFGLLIATFIAIVFVLKIIEGKANTLTTAFIPLVISSYLLLDAIYIIGFHEPGLRFYRSLMAIIPFTLFYIVSDRLIKNFPQRAFWVVILIITLVFIILSPIIKWGWMFVGYPTTHDIELTNFIIKHFERVLDHTFHAPGSHQLLSFYFKYLEITGSVSVSRISITAGDNLAQDDVTNASLIATYYRIAIYPRWLGEDINDIKAGIELISSSNNKLYANGEFWVLISKDKVLS